MDKIFKLPADIRSSNLWIDKNDALTNYSEIKITNDYCIVPYHIYEDSLCDDDDINKDMVQCQYNFKYPRHLFSQLHQLRVKSYYACVRYPEIKTTIPTAESILIPIESILKLKKDLKKNILNYPFVRLCNMSPKDIRLPLYNDWKEAFNDLITSIRTNDFTDKHLFMRKKKIYEWEARCFWSHGKLRAVSLPDLFIEDVTKEIKTFFKQYGKYIPYHSATVDIGKTDCIELIEFNTFGPDMNATSGQFSWIEDIMILLFSQTPVFR